VRRVLFAAAITAGLAWQPAAAQLYPQLTPLPRTTAPSVLRSQATQREVHERFARGIAAETRGDWPQAEAEFTRIIALAPPEPQRSTAHYDLGIAQVQLRELDAAAASFQKAIALDPGFLAAHANLVTAHLLQGDLAAARTVADRFVALAPDSARALYGRGLIALQAGDATTALHDFGTLLERNPRFATAHYDVALAEIKLGRLADAERELQTALGLAPQFARAQFALGTVLLRAGKRDEARIAFDQAARVAQDATLRTLALSLRDSIVR